MFCGYGTLNVLCVITHITQAMAFTSEIHANSTSDPLFLSTVSEISQVDGRQSATTNINEVVIRYIYVSIGVIGGIGNVIAENTVQPRDTLNTTAYHTETLFLGT